MGCPFCLRGCFHPFRRGVTMNDKKSDPLVEFLGFAIKQFLAWIGEKQRGVKRGQSPFAKYVAREKSCRSILQSILLRQRALFRFAKKFLIA